MSTPADQSAIGAEDEDVQTGGAAVLLKYLLYPMKELSGKLGRLNNFNTCCSAGSPGECLASGKNLQRKKKKKKKKKKKTTTKKPADNSSSQRVGDRLNELSQQKTA